MVINNIKKQLCKVCENKECEQQGKCDKIEEFMKKENLPIYVQPEKINNYNVNTFSNDLIDSLDFNTIKNIQKTFLNSGVMWEVENSLIKILDKKISPKKKIEEIQIILNFLLAFIPKATRKVRAKVFNRTIYQIRWWDENKK